MFLVTIEDKNFNKLNFEFRYISDAGDFIEAVFENASDEVKAVVTIKKDGKEK